ncbi:erythromycin esterase family protein [Sediminitomix flava]|uniref:Erythromycin esterase-like protein n=1 Tax=Sediminitomix flava TaxID=379075 RepID=A0A315ZGI8_SEDFL|nr:erythromycin esterase family protein [Sediminitomix flava]PWJ44273.1 erythromycin esterase-like protein [Sediminitomix flava]
MTDNKTIISLLLSLFTILPLAAQNTSQFEELVEIKSISPSDANYQDLQFLKKEIGETRVVALGEAQHDFGELYEAKTRVVQFLHEEMDFDLILFESGFYDLKKAHEAIQNGESAKLHLGNSIFPIWTLRKEFHPFINYVASHKDSLGVLGFDSQAIGDDYITDFEEDILRLIGDDSENVFYDWLEFVEVISEFNFPDDLVSHLYFQKINTQIKNRIQENAVATKAEKDFYIHLLDNLSLMAKDYYKNRTGDKTAETFQAEDNNVRDRLMAENTLFWLNRYPNKKVILWGATAHVANQVGDLDEEEFKTFKPMGYHLNESLGEENIFTIGFTGFTTDSTCASSPTSLEAKFTKEGKKAVYLSAKDFKPFNSHALSLFDPNFEGKWENVVDGLILIDTLTRATVSSIELTVDTPKDAGSEKVTASNVESVEVKSDTARYVIFNREDESLVKLKGKIRDKNSKEGIPYINIGIPNTLLGTSTNTKGEYVLQLPKGENRTIRISSIGYMPLELSVKQFKENPVIELEPSIRELTEITVTDKPLTAKAIMKQVIKNIPNNFIQTPFSQSKIIRFRGWVDSLTFKQREVLFNDYDLNGYQKAKVHAGGKKRSITVKQSRIADVPKGRDFTNLAFENDSRDFSWAWMFYDAVDAQKRNFLNKANLRKYDFELEEIIESEDGELQYLILFKTDAKSIRTTNLLGVKELRGSILINASDFGIERVEYLAFVDKAYRMWGNVLNRKELSDIVFYKKVVTTYKKVGNHYFLDHKLFQTNFDKHLPIHIFHEIIGLDVQVGEKDSVIINQRKVYPQEEYNPKDWEHLPSK